MNTSPLSFKLLIDGSPTQVFEAINDVSAWWSGSVAGPTDVLGAEFTYQYRDMHRSRQQIRELVPGKRVVWQVTDSHLSFVTDKDEWTGTEIVFELAPEGDRTELTFTHRGLTESCECYDACSRGWGSLIRENLCRLIEKRREQAPVEPSRQGLRPGVRSASA